ncbi:MAG: HAMP domain-containing sensor histidine kinase [Candidatus Omnitrophica bacterium]|nr:HAMP domain-containing sensor histidine kinase [Candidatus Omnitrophota bacterium]MDD5671464.1 HAMP domain-containing sensor histidine kinase [Candidatus Omnitrophota bacterium]
MVQMQHNVVSILYAVKGMIETYFSRMEENRFEDQETALRCARELLTKIYIQADRAIQITKRIGMAMKNAGTGEESLEYVSVHEVWNEVADALVAKYAEGDYDMIRHIPPEFPRIKCRRNDLVEILFCLAENAVQAMGLASSGNGSAEYEPECQAKQAGKLIIRTNLGFRSGEEPIASITISDTGPGIPEDMLANLFEPFMSTKVTEHGNGLGLCLVKSLVRKNGGSISVSSFKDFGTTFTLSFPIAQSGNRDQTLKYVLK